MLLLQIVSIALIEAVEKIVAPPPVAGDNNNNIKDENIESVINKLESRFKEVGIASLALSYIIK